MNLEPVMYLNKINETNFSNTILFCTISLQLITLQSFQFRKCFALVGLLHESSLVPRPYFQLSQCCMLKSVFQHATLIKLGIGP